MSVHEPANHNNDVLADFQQLAPPTTPTERSRIPEEVTRIVSSYMNTGYEAYEAETSLYSVVRRSVHSVLEKQVDNYLESQVSKRETRSSSFDGDIGSVELKGTQVHLKKLQEMTAIDVKGTIFGEGWSEGEGTSFDERINQVEPLSGSEQEAFEKEVKEEMEGYQPPGAEEDLVHL
ncbi:hypothetical protein IAR50_000020 [Cryptococcus sp. DSM 104548]